MYDESLDDEEFSRRQDAMLMAMTIEDYRQWHMKIYKRPVDLDFPLSLHHYMQLPAQRPSTRFPNDGESNTCFSSSLLFTVLNLNRTPKKTAYFSDEDLISVRPFSDKNHVQYEELPCFLNHDVELSLLRNIFKDIHSVLQADPDEFSESYVQFLFEDHLNEHFDHIYQTAEISSNPTINAISNLFLSFIERYLTPSMITTIVHVPDGIRALHDIINRIFKGKTPETGYQWLEDIWLGECQIKLSQSSSDKLTNEVIKVLYYKLEELQEVPRLDFDIDALLAEANSFVQKKSQEPTGETRTSLPPSGSSLLKSSLSRKELIAFFTVLSKTNNQENGTKPYMLQKEVEHFVDSNFDVGMASPPTRRRLRHNFLPNQAHALRYLLYQYIQRERKQPVDGKHNNGDYAQLLKTNFDLFDDIDDKVLAKSMAKSLSFPNPFEPQRIDSICMNELGYKLIEKNIDPLSN